ncbi:hypothetical protein J421_5327 (plasmid) [Gemmatirosa kalamazoonensis]|uniref:Uncharacterized protein n=1 Tax=Gemmatirosa kalamazoonensis TaxID=861299 RepID=W0RQW9_9BACT|nr:hypothetical protein [Gemmatirosa kalamazoonensis]AHG92862.1 hypothetical protein J421_5327 [Gemmatirosa kalamazoonensis]
MESSASLAMRRFRMLALIVSPIAALNLVHGAARLALGAGDQVPECALAAAAGALLVVAAAGGALGRRWAPRLWLLGLATGVARVLAALAYAYRQVPNAPAWPLALGAAVALVVGVVLARFGWAAHRAGVHAAT